MVRDADSASTVTLTVRLLISKDIFFEPHAIAASTMRWMLGLRPAVDFLKSIAVVVKLSWTISKMSVMVLPLSFLVLPSIVLGFFSASWLGLGCWNSAARWSHWSMMIFDPLRVVPASWRRNVVNISWLCWCRDCPYRRSIKSTCLSLMMVGRLGNILCSSKILLRI